MKKTLLAFIVGLILPISLYGVVVFAQAVGGPYLVSDPEPTVAQNGVFQIEVNGVVQPEVYPVEQLAVKLDVQSFEGQKNIRARFGNPWPELENTYKWSEWSNPFDYAFPIQSGAPKILRVASE